MPGRHELVVVLFLHPVPVGTEFKASDWPLHVTLVPPFCVECELAALVTDLEAIVAEHAPLVVRVSGQARFGPRHDVAVALLEDHKALRALHARLVDLLASQYGVSFTRPDRLRAGYRPHVTKQRAGSATDGQTLALINVTLVDRSPDGTPGLRKIVQNFPLGSLHREA